MRLNIFSPVHRLGAPGGICYNEGSKRREGTPLATILIAEDDADIRSVLRLYLESEGYRVTEAESGTRALELARAQTPDLAILDVMMPGMNGYELTKALRAFTDIPVLILSARSQDNDKILGLNLGADDYIAKPFNPMEVTARVKAHLRRAARTAAPALSAGGLTLEPRVADGGKGRRARGADADGVQDPLGADARAGAHLHKGAAVRERGGQLF